SIQLPNLPHFVSTVSFLCLTTPSPTFLTATRRCVELLRVKSFSDLTILPSLPGGGDGLPCEIDSCCADFGDAPFAAMVRLVDHLCGNAVRHRGDGDQCGQSDRLEHR